MTCDMLSHIVSFKVEMLKTTSKYLIFQLHILEQENAGFYKINNTIKSTYSKCSVVEIMTAK